MLNANSRIILISCIDKKRSIKDIAREWDYKYESGKLYHGNSQEELLSNKFVKKEKKGKYVLYIANMKAFSKYMKKAVEAISEDEETEANIKTALEDNFDLFMEFLQEDFVVNEVLGIENIKTLYYSDRTLIPDNFDECFLSVFLSLVIFFIADGPNKERLLNIFSTLLARQLGCKINTAGFIRRNIEIFDENWETVEEYKTIYDEYQSML